MNPHGSPLNRRLSGDLPERSCSAGNHGLRSSCLAPAKIDLHCEDQFDIGIDNFTVNSAVRLAADVILVKGSEKIVFYENGLNEGWKPKNSLMEEVGPFICKQLDGVEFVTLDTFGRLVIWNYSTKESFTLTGEVNDLKSVTILNKDTIIAGEDCALVLFHRQGAVWTRCELGGHTSPIVGVEAVNKQIFVAYTADGEVSHWDLGIWPPRVGIRYTGIENLVSVTPLNRNLFILRDEENIAYSLTITDEGFWIQDFAAEQDAIPLFTDSLGSEITVQVGRGGKISIISNSDALEYESKQKRFCSEILSTMIFNPQLVVAGCQDGTLRFIECLANQQWVEQAEHRYGDPIVNLSRFDQRTFLSVLSSGHLELLSIQK